MPPIIKKTTGGSTYGIPFIGRVDHTVHVQVDPALLSTSQVDAKGILKPGVVLPMHGGALGSTNGTAQVETHTVAGTITGAGNAKVIVTSVLLPNGAKTVTFAVANTDTASQVATKARAALTADTDISPYFTVSGAGADIVLTAKTQAVNDATLKMETNNDTSTGLTNTTVSANTTAGVAPDDAVMVFAPTKIAENNLALASITPKPMVACAVIAVANRAIVEDNLGRSLTATELAALRNSKISLTLNQ